jgi:hypothetical protein
VLILYCGIHGNKGDGLLTREVFGGFALFLLTDSYKIQYFKLKDCNSDKSPSFLKRG